MELQDTVATLFLAGYETVAKTLASAVYHCVTNPEALKRIKEEIRQNFSSGEEINAANIDRLKYTKAVLDETLRIAPPCKLRFSYIIYFENLASSN
jgi:cytochrome P450